MDLILPLVYLIFGLFTLLEEVTSVTRILNGQSLCVLVIRKYMEETPMGDL